MPRGTLKIYKNIFNPSTSPSRKSRGRSRTLIAERNQCLVARYYYYGQFSKKTYNKIIEQLSHEFFLSTVTITEIITEHMEVLDRLKEAKPVLSFFSDQWQHLKW